MYNLTAKSRLKGAGFQTHFFDEMPEEQAFYDNPEVRSQYLAHRDRPDNPNDALERPIFLELAGHLTGLDIID